MSQQPAEEHDMSATDIQQIQARLAAVCASDAVVENDATRAHYRARLARASRPAVALRMTNSRPAGSL